MGLYYLILGPYYLILPKSIQLCGKTLIFSQFLLTKIGIKAGQPAEMLTNRPIKINNPAPCPMKCVV